MGQLLVSLKRAASDPRATLGKLFANHRNTEAGRFIKGAMTSANRTLNRSYVLEPKAVLYVEATGKCNLRCRFCAYPKKMTGKVAMLPDDFTGLMDEVASLGYRTIDLTPTTGEVFADKYFMDKLDYLEGLDGIDEYRFFTNFILPSESDVQRLVALRKLSKINVSIYGHDLDSFLAMTDSNANSRVRLTRNLQTLFDSVDDQSPALDFHLRTRKQFEGVDSSDDELCRLLVKLRDERGSAVYMNQWYDNWGGLVSQDDVEGLDIEIIPEDDVEKNGACRLIFGANMIRSDGRVSACYCRDQDALLQIGHTEDTPLSELLSSKNIEMKKLIEKQQRGEFPDICKSCTEYRSIYSQPNPFPDSARTKWTNVEDFLANW